MTSPKADHTCTAGMSRVKGESWVGSKVTASDEGTTLGAMMFPRPQSLISVHRMTTQQMQRRYLQTDKRLGTVTSPLVLPTPVPSATEAASG